MRSRSYKALYDWVSSYLIIRGQYYLNSCFCPYRSYITWNLLVAGIEIPISSSKEDRGADLNHHLHFISMSDQTSQMLGKVERLIQSLRIYDIQPIILNDYNPKYGNWSKIRGMRRFLETDKAIHPDALVIFVDGHDVCAVSSPVELSASFTSYEVDVLFGAENVFAHQQERHRCLFEAWHHGAKHRYLNAGFVMGRKRKLLTFYRYLDSIISRLRFLPIYRSDQAIIGCAFVVMKSAKNCLRLGIDFRGECITTIPAHSEKIEIRSPLVHVTGLNLFSSQIEVFDDIYYRHVLQKSQIDVRSN
jgi:hypothetical protein